MTLKECSDIFPAARYLMTLSGVAAPAEAIARLVERLWDDVQASAEQIRQGTDGQDIDQLVKRWVTRHARLAAGVGLVEAAPFLLPAGGALLVPAVMALEHFVLIALAIRAQLGCIALRRGAADAAEAAVCVLSSIGLGGLRAEATRRAQGGVTRAAKRLLNYTWGQWFKDIFRRLIGRASWKHYASRAIPLLGVPVAMAANHRAIKTAVSLVEAAV